MKRTPPLVVSIVFVTAAFAVAQATRPATKESAEEIARRFGTTVEQLERMVKRELGEPVVVDNGLIVGVHRDAAGHVTTVKIATDEHSIEFNRHPSETRVGFQVLGGELRPDAPFSSATDFDGDGRIDQIMFKSAGKPGVILLRLGERFEPATAAGGGKRFTLTSTARTQRFDFTQREWIDDTGN